MLNAKAAEKPSGICHFSIFGQLIHRELYAAFPLGRAAFFVGRQILEKIIKYFERLFYAIKIKNMPERCLKLLKTVSIYFIRQKTQKKVEEIFGKNDQKSIFDRITLCHFFERRLPMLESLELLMPGETIRIQLKNPDLYDPSVFDEDPWQLFLPCISLNARAGTAEFERTGMISLRAFLQASSFDKSEACSFLYALCTALEKAMKNQPAIPALDAIFLSPKGDVIRFCRAPLMLEAWMLQKDDLRQFLAALLDAFPCEAVEILGLLYQSIRQEASLAELCTKIEALYQSFGKKKLFARHTAIPPFSAKKALLSEDGTARQDESPNRPARLFSSGSAVKGQEGQAGEKPGREAGSLCEDRLPDSSVCESGFPAAANFLLADEQQPAGLEDRDEPEQGGFPYRSDSTAGFSGYVAEETVQQDAAGDFWQQPVVFEPMPMPVFEPDPDLIEQAASPLHTANPDSGADWQKEAASPMQASPADLKRPSKKPESRMGEIQSLQPARHPIPAADAVPTMLLEEIVSPCSLEIAGTSCPLEGGQVLIGRHASCQIVLQDPSVSLQHAKLTCQDGRWYVQDLKSTNATWLNSKKVIRRMRLKEGMVIRFGKREAIFHEQPLQNS